MCKEGFSQMFHWKGVVCKEGVSQTFRWNPKCGMCERSSLVVSKLCTCVFLTCEYVIRL